MKLDYQPQEPTPDPGRSWRSRANDWLSVIGALLRIALVIVVLLIAIKSCRS